MPAMQLALDPFSRAARDAVITALQAIDPGARFDDDAFAVAAPPRPELGDFAVGLFAAARAVRQAPPRLAAQVAEAFQPGELLAEASAAGPFVNFRAHRPALYRYLFQASAAGPGEGLLPATLGAGKTVCIDYSSPNISKHLAYHHIRSTVIGHALVNLYRALGYRVIGINHLGDWGTTHGMLIAAYKMWGAAEPLTITALNDLYVRFRAAAKEDPALDDMARAWFKKLEDGDSEARELWQRFRDVSWAEFAEVYHLLGIEFEEVLGESDFMKDVPAVLALLEERDLLAESDGALVVPAPEGSDAPPMLLRKQDGATLYGTRDLAAAIHRHDTYGFEHSLYVVDRGQALHFAQLFGALERAGFAWAAKCAHVPFGLVRVGGKKTGTRTGNVVLLREVLAEAESRAVAVVEDNAEKSAVDLGPAEKLATARAVGFGAVVFANLVSQREKDVDFEWNEILSTSGDSGPYIQYAHARCASILRKARDEAVSSGDAQTLRKEGTPERPGDAASALDSDHEWALARALLEFSGAVQRSARGNEPHLLCRYLLDLCAVFSRWYTAGNQDRELRVLSTDPHKRRARTGLVAATRDVLARGLGLLGLEAPDVM